MADGAEAAIAGACAMGGLEAGEFLIADAMKPHKQDPLWMDGSQGRDFLPLLFVCWSGKNSDLAG